LAAWPAIALQILPNEGELGDIRFSEQTELSRIEAV
jgi:hypothetical protein